MPTLDDMIEPGSRPWWIFLGILVLGRSMDLLSTWVASPTLALEANPVARRLGWRWGLAVNLALVLVFAGWPMLAISLSTTSFLVAARNFQHAWLMRSMGEIGYRFWFADRVSEARKWMVVACYLMEALLTGVVGGVLVWFSRWDLIPFSVGMGVVAYACAVGLFTGVALARRS